MSLEQKVRKVVTQATRASRDELVRRVDEIRAMTPVRVPAVPDRSAEELIRQDRDAR